jgi:hypothetical protein
MTTYPFEKAYVVSIHLCIECRPDSDNKCNSISFITNTHLPKRIDVVQPIFYYIDLISWWMGETAECICTYIALLYLFVSHHTSRVYEENI